MPYSLFHSRFPEVAERETRTIIVIDPSHFNLPPAHYSFLEMFCNEPGCDCRRVFFSVVSSLQNDIKAVIAWGWEDQGFYVKWMGDDDPHVINDLLGPVLNLASPQSDLAPALLKLFQAVLLQDTAYIERIKRHYVMFRETVDTKTKKKCQGKREKGKNGRHNLSLQRKGRNAATIGKSCWSAAEFCVSRQEECS